MQGFGSSPFKCGPRRLSDLSFITNAPERSKIRGQEGISIKEGSQPVLGPNERRMDALGEAGQVGAGREGRRAGEE